MNTAASPTLLEPSPRALKRPSLALFTAEPWRAAGEFVAYKASALSRHRAATATGDGHPVIIFPGMATDGRAVRPLRDFCRSRGYNALDWGRGFNTGPKGNVDAWLAELAAHTEAVLARYDQRATLIGWSLGGLYARELGKLLAPRVRQVITLGTPFNADQDSTRVGWLFRRLSGATPAFDAALSQRLRTPPPVPTTSIYSRGDGVVAWQSCLHAQPSATVQDVEVRGSHSGMGWNRAVLRVVADRLAQPDGRWLPYVAAL